MIRPQPPLSALHFFAPESDEEKRIRQQLGFSTNADEKDMEQQAMKIDQSVEPGEHIAAASLMTTGSLHVALHPRQEVPHVTLGQKERDNVPAPIILDSAPSAAEIDNPVPSAKPLAPTIAPDSHPATVAPDARGAISFMSRPTASTVPRLDKGKGKVVEPEIRRREASDSPFPELDSGSDEFEDDEEEDQEDEEDEEG